MGMCSVFFEVRTEVKYCLDELRLQRVKSRSKKPLSELYKYSSGGETAPGPDHKAVKTYWDVEVKFYAFLLCYTWKLVQAASAFPLQ
jgi:hypothetical protein